MKGMFYWRDITNEYEFNGIEEKEDRVILTRVDKTTDMMVFYKIPDFRGYTIKYGSHE